MDMRHPIRFARLRLQGPASIVVLAAVLGALSVTLAARSAQQPSTEDPALLKVPVQTVWPLPPETPRLEYVALYSTSTDVEGEPQKSRLFRLKETLLGKERMADQLPRGRELRKPFGVAVDSRGRIIVTDTDLAAVFVMDIEGKTFQQLGADERQVVLRVPIGVAVDRQDNIYVGDNSLHVVMQFGPDLRYVRTLGEPGDIAGPSSMAVDLAGTRLYAVDTQGHQLVVFDLASGNLVNRVGKKGVGPGEFGFPSGVAVGADGTVYVSDTMNYRVQVFDPSLKFVRSFGELGDSPGRFRRPKGIAVDAEGIIYVVDSDFNNFQMFDPEGQPLLAVGEYGMRPGQMMLPAGIAVQPATRRIFVADQMNRRVQVFERVGARLGEK